MRKLQAGQLWVHPTANLAPVYIREVGEKQSFKPSWLGDTKLWVDYIRGRHSLSGRYEKIADYIVNNNLIVNQLSVGDLVYVKDSTNRSVMTISAIAPTDRRKDVDRPFYLTSPDQSARLWAPGCWCSYHQLIPLFSI